MTDSSIGVFFSLMGRYSNILSSRLHRARERTHFLLYPYAYSFSQIWYLWRNAAHNSKNLESGGEMFADLSYFTPQ
jgi:hypothetical protein